MTSHYEERLEQDLAAIRRGIVDVGSAVEKALRDALHAVLIGDLALASQTILGDLPINRRVRELDAQCHTFVARHLPSAGHLRFVSSVLRLSVALERVGDYAVTVAREQAQLSAPPSEEVLRDIELIGEQSLSMFRQAMEAFNADNAELARGTMAMAAQIDATFQKVYRDLLHEGETGASPVKDHFAVLTILNRVGRVAAQAKNICEETLFVVSGETKEPKVYRLLFVDERDDALTQLAVAYARRAYPESGIYASAGWRAADRLEPRCKIFLERKGFEPSDLKPTDLHEQRDRLDETHVIVGLGAGVREQLAELPFHTVLVEWEVGVCPNDLDQERAEAALESGFEQLKLEIGRLMETLRGAAAT